MVGSAKQAPEEESGVGPRSGLSEGRNEFPAGYEDLGRIASGGMGEVRRAQDLRMNRVVAVKLLHWEHLSSLRTKARFQHEADVLAQLQHPGLVPIYERGELSNGRPWFSMQEVRGRTLSAIIAATHEGDGPERRSSVQQLVGLLHRIAETVAYAHSRGYVHRDIKPSNLMLGEFGEALVMDWGIATRTGTIDKRGPASSPVPSRLTQTGDLLGTLAYMAPEQARGKAVTARTDVYSLGLVLLEILTGSRAITGSAMGLLGRLQGDARFEFDEVWKASALRSPELKAIIEKATQHNASDRHPDAGTFARALRGWLDGDDRRRRAQSLFGEAKQQQERIAGHRQRLTALCEEARSLRASLAPYAGAEAKRSLWRTEDEADALRRELELEEAALVEALRVCLQHDPDFEAARDALVDLARQRSEDLEDSGDHRGAEPWHRIIASFGDEDATSGDASLSVCPPPGAHWSLHRYVLRERRWRLGEAQLTGDDVLTNHRLSPGRYLLRFEGPDGAEARYPLLLHRRGRQEVLPFVMPIADELGPDDIFVPGGSFIAGGDDIAPEPFARHRVWVEPFVIRRYPVTNAEYLAFLNDLIDTGRPEEANRFAPKFSAAITGRKTTARVVHRTPSGRFEFGPDESGEISAPDCPVAHVDWHSACAYADWLRERTGQGWRLPCELEWEKAGRGVDARTYPWGTEPEPTWAVMLGSTSDTPGRRPVHRFPEDESPYGVRGMAGNVREWCRDRWTHEGPLRPQGRLQIESRPTCDDLRVIRGGSWIATTHLCRLAGRFGSDPNVNLAVVGFRLARSFRSERSGL